MSGTLPLREMSLLSRYAEGLFWMARYLERAENMARLLDVTQDFEQPGQEAESWYALVRINADEASYAVAAASPDARAIKGFYLLDRTNPTSIPSALEHARTNARTLRPMISTEMWVQLNVLYRDALALRDADLDGDALSRVCRRLKEGVQAQAGITEGTLFRDQGWHFYQLGRLIERADQTTRLLDINYRLLVPGTGEEAQAREIARWAGLLRGAAGYHAFRRVAPPSFEPADVIDFLLCNTAFPRSVLLCIDHAEWHLGQLRSRHGLRGTAAGLERAEEMRGQLLSVSATGLAMHGLHEFLDSMQLQLSELAAEIGTAFFRDWRPRLATAAEATQSQASGVARQAIA